MGRLDAYGYVALGGVFTGSPSCDYQVACVLQSCLSSLPNAQLWSTANMNGGANLSLVQCQAPQVIQQEGTTENLIPSSSFLSQGETSWSYKRFE